MITQTTTINCCSSGCCCCCRCGRQREIDELNRKIDELVRRRNALLFNGLPATPHWFPTPIAPPYNYPVFLGVGDVIKGINKKLK